MSFNTFSNGTLTGGLGIYDQEVLPSSGLFAMRQDPYTLKGQFSNNGGAWQDFEAGGTPVAITGGSNINVSTDISGNYVVSTVSNPIFGTINGTTAILSGALSCDTASIGTLSSGSANIGNLTVTGTITYGGSFSLTNLLLSGTLGVNGISSLKNTNITGTLSTTGTITCVDITSSGNIGCANITCPNAFHTVVNTSTINVTGLTNLANTGVQILGTDTVNAKWRIGTPAGDLIGIGGDNTNNIAIGSWDPSNTTFSERFRFAASGNFGINTSNPTQALNVVGNALITGTVNSRNMTTDGANLDTLVSRVNQPLNILSSPSFAALTVGQLNSPNMQIKNSPNANSCQINSPISGGTIRFASNSVEFIAMTNDSIYVNNLRAYASTITLRSNMPCDSGVLIDGRDISVDGSALDLVVSRVNQDVKNTASPTWPQILSSTGTSRWLTGYSTAFPGTHTALEYYAPNMTGSTVQVLLGRDNAANGSAVIKHNFVSGLDGNNSCNIGLSGNENILTVHGEGYIKGNNIVLQGSGKALQGGLRINSGTTKFEYYNGSAWVAPESAPTAILPSITLSWPSSSSIVISNDSSSNCYMDFVGTSGTRAIRSNIAGTPNVPIITTGTNTVTYDYFRLGTNATATNGNMRLTSNAPEIYNGTAWTPVKPISGTLTISKAGATVTSSISSVYGTLSASYDSGTGYVFIQTAYDTTQLCPMICFRDVVSDTGNVIKPLIATYTSGRFAVAPIVGNSVVNWNTLTDFYYVFNFMAV